MASYEKDFPSSQKNPIIVIYLHLYGGTKKYTRKNFPRKKDCEKSNNKTVSQKK